MDFSLSEEQQMLADLVARFVEREYDFEARRQLLASEQGWSQENWAALAETGLLALNVPEAHGGLQASATETMVVMQAFGRALLLEPYLPTAVVGAALLGKAASAEQQEALLPALAAGELRVALATLEPQARFDLWDIVSIAQRTPAGFTLTGRKSVVQHGDSADQLIVSARTSGTRHDRSGISLFLVDATAPGVQVRGFTGLDGQRVAEVSLCEVQLDEAALIGTLDNGFSVLEWAVDRGLFALCAEAIGSMERLVEMSVSYLQERKQFGQPIGKFQALQHKIADMLGYLEQSRSITLYAAANLDNEDSTQRRKAVSAAKTLVGQAGRFIAQQAIQLHGGMGMTDELAVGSYVKRLTSIDMTWGDSDHHVELYAEVL